MYRTDLELGDRLAFGVEVAEVGAWWWTIVGAMMGMEWPLEGAQQRDASDAPRADTGRLYCASLLLSAHVYTRNSLICPHLFWQTSARVLAFESWCCHWCVLIKQGLVLTLLACGRAGEAEAGRVYTTKSNKRQTLLLRLRELIQGLRCAHLKHHIFAFLS